MELINESIGVRADFVSGKIRPVRFVWRGRQYLVQQVSLTFARSDGNRKYLCFSVDVGGMMVELAMDRQDFSWRIAACAPSFT